MDDAVQEMVIGGAWIFLGSLSISLGGFVFWLVIARLVGAKDLGVASAVVSCSSIAVTFISAGLNIAVMREVAVRGLNALVTSTVLALIMGIGAAFLAALLADGLGYLDLIGIAFFLALANTISTPLLSGLLGLERFREYFAASFTGSLAKVLFGIALAVLGFKVLAPLLGYLAYPIVAAMAAIALITRVPRADKIKLDPGELKSLVSLTYSNYPYMFSNQLLSMLSVYVFAFLVGEALSTGTLYIALMIALAISAIPSSILNAALPVGARRNADPFSEGFRIGLGLATPMIAIALAAPTLILEAINPELVRGADSLRILLLSIAPLTALTAVIIKLNKDGEKGKLSALGLARLVVLAALLPILTKIIGVDGAAVAFLLASALLIPFALKIEPRIFRPAAILWCIHFSVAIFATLAPVNEFISAVIALAASTALMHVTKTYTITEYWNTVKTVMNTIFP